MKVDPVDLINATDGPFWISGLASELWPVLEDRLDELDPLPRQAVEHYAEQAIRPNNSA